MNDPQAPNTPRPGSPCPTPAAPGPTPAHAPYPHQPPPAAKVPREPRVYSAREQLLAPVSLGLGALLVWLLSAPGISLVHSPFVFAVFWLCWLAVFYAWNWKRLRSQRLLWLAAGLIALLCGWNFLHDYRSSYGALTAWVIPGALMAHAVLSGGEYRWKQVGAMARGWLAGWFVRPFSAIPLFFGSCAFSLSSRRGGKARKVLLAVVIALPLLLVIIPLLRGADQVFGYFLDSLLRGFSVPRLLARLFFTACAGMLLYSFLWNTCANQKTAQSAGEKRGGARLDPLVAWIVLGILLAVYLLFCAVQFTYLFAGSGLPPGMTYSEYAREGFWQLVVVAGINLLLFSAGLQLCHKGRALWVMLGILLAVTGVLLASGWLRLMLYVGTYGLTWLRLLSGWFILYLAVVLVLCAVRLVREQLPLVAVCAYLLLTWYVVLGYANPDALVARYNMDHAPSAREWVEEHRQFVRWGLSDDGKLAAAREAGLDAVYPDALPTSADGYSAASRRLNQLVRDAASQEP